MKKIVVLLVLSMLVSTLPLCGFAIDESTGYNFEDGVVPTSDIANLKGGSKAEIKTDSSNDNKYLELYSVMSDETKIGAEWRYRTGKKFDNQTVEITFDIMKPESYASAEVMLYNLVGGSTSNGSSFGTLAKFTNDGKIQIFGYDYATYDTTTWYNFKFLLSAQKGYVECQMKAATDTAYVHVGTFPVKLSSKEVDDITVVFKQNRYETGSSLYIDNANIIESNEVVAQGEDFSTLPETETTVTEKNNQLLYDAGLDTNWSLSLIPSSGSFCGKTIPGGDKALYTSFSSTATINGEYRLLKKFFAPAVTSRIHAELSPEDMKAYRAIYTYFSNSVSGLAETSSAFLKLLESGQIVIGNFDTGVTYQAGDKVVVDGVFTRDDTTYKNATFTLTITNGAQNATITKTLAEVGISNPKKYLRGLALYSKLTTAADADATSVGGTYWDNISVTPAGYLVFNQPTIVDPERETFINEKFGGLTGTATTTGVSGKDSEGATKTDATLKTELAATLNAQLTTVGLTGWTSAFDNAVSASVTGKELDGNTALYTSLSKGPNNAIGSYRLYKTMTSSVDKVNIHAEVVPEDLYSMRVFQLYMGESTKVSLVKIMSSGDIHIGKADSNNAVENVLTYEAGDKIVIDVVYELNADPGASKFTITIDNTSDSTPAWTGTKTLSDLGGSDSSLTGIGIRNYFGRENRDKTSKTCWDNFSVTEAKELNATASFTMQNTTAEAASYVFMLGAYDESGILLNVAMQSGTLAVNTEYNKAQLTLPEPDGTVEYKAFVWDVFGKMTPLQYNDTTE